LLLALDEIANIAPLQSLPSLVSEGGGRGIVTMWATQSLAQLRNRYGIEQQAAILAATTAKLIFGGMSNGEDLHNISSWAGEEKQTTTSTQLGPQTGLPATGPTGVAGGMASQNHTVSNIFRPALPISSIQLLPPFHAWLFWRSDPHFQIEARPAGMIPEFQQMKGFTP
jgi:hypothetical protein